VGAHVLLVDRAVGRPAHGHLIFLPHRPLHGVAVGPHVLFVNGPADRVFLHHVVGLPDGPADRVAVGLDALLVDRPADGVRALLVAGFLDGAVLDAGARLVDVLVADLVRRAGRAALLLTTER